MEAFTRDCIELAVERLKRGELDRRGFLAGLAALGFAPVALESGPAAAQAKEIVLVNWGGDALKTFYTAWGEPYTKDTGVKVVMDGTGPSVGKIKAMVESGKVTWDCCDSGGGSCLTMGKLGVLDAFDFGTVDKTKLINQQFSFPWGIGNYLFSYVIAWDTTKFGGKAPKSWADFWNLKEFPGKRTMRKDIQAALEAALMADGVPIDKLYPLDVDRGFKKIKEIKDSIIFWASGSESQQLLRDGEVTMGSLWNTRVNAMVKELNERFTWTWNQGILCAGTWVVPKGNPAGKDVYKFIASTQIPERQVALFQLFGNGPINPASIPLIPADKKRFDPGTNAGVQVAILDTWYGEHQEKANNDFLDLIAS